ncbi:pyridoxal phosphate-dependent aminotransferase [Fusobacterium sp. PH5-44]|uniref:pyridoxal phosphate-dependent aminotransferase n=1 Tax=unclassified Fusobacterium TaxID=2648384 RepID=UPI003D1BF714
MHISKKAQVMKFSSVRKLLPFADAAEKNGIKVYKLNIGQPDVATPDSFFEGLHNFKDKVVKYADSKGLIQLRETFSNNYKKSGIDFNTDEILVTQGGSEAITFVMLTICDEGDEILIPEPFYANYASFIDIAGAKIVPIPTKIENGFHLPSREEIEKLITPKTRGILYSNPGNPTGTVYTKNEIEMMGEVAKKNDLFIIADEVYRDFIYDEEIKHVSPTNYKDLEDRTIVIDSISKHYSACGARIGLIASKNKELMNYLLKFCQSRLSASMIDQVAAANLANTDEHYVENAKNIYKRRRDLLYKHLNSIPGVVSPKPEGALYILVKLPVKDSEDFAKWILTDYSYKNKTLLIAPGPGFYQTEGLGRDQVRISFCGSEDDIENGMIVLKNALDAYNKLKK